MKYKSGEYTIKLKGQEKIRLYLAKYQVKTLYRLNMILGIEEIELIKQYRA